VKKVPAHQDEIDLFIDRAALQNVHPCVEKVAWTFDKLVPRASQMHISKMEKLHMHIISGVA
jgi:predicted GNAT superfamily acetyltransferase